MVAPNFKKVTDTNPDNPLIYGASDLRYAFDVLDGTHPTDRLQQINIEGINQNFGYNAIVRKEGSTYFGYREDGAALSTPSSSSAHLVIQSALDYCSSIGGGRVLLRNATYTITNSILIPNNIVLTGESRDLTILRTDSSLTVNSSLRNSDTTNGNNHITISNLTIDNTDVETGSGGAMISFTSVEHSILYMLHLKNVSSIAISWESTTDQRDNVIAFCLIESLNRAIPKPTVTHPCNLQDLSDSLFVNNILAELGGGTGHAAVRFNVPKRTLIANNVVWNSSASGILVQNANDSVISSNMSRNNGEHGIYLFGQANLRCSVTNNMCRINGIDGMRIEGNDIIVSSSHCGENHEAGINISGADRCLVTQNMCRNNGKDTAATPTDRRAGIRLSGGTATNVIQSNKCFDDQGTRTQVYGVAEESGTGVDDNIIVDNHVIDNLTAGVLMTGAGTSAKHNMGFNPQGVTTQSTPSSGGTYTNNDRVPEAIYMRGGSGVTVTKNGITIANETPNTIWLEPGDAITISYSTAPTIVKDRK
jgi:hypothetical protein